MGYAEKMKRTTGQFSLPVRDKKLIEELIPHRDPVMLIDSLDGYEDNKAVSRFSVRADCLFVKNSVFSEVGLLENMAQTAALHRGYKGKLSGKKPQIGFIATVKKFEVSGSALVGDQLETEIRITFSAMNMTVTEGQVKLNGECIATATMATVIKAAED